ncbi:unnamed protein product [Heterobilharzia americana]|nr:unnamed protein product [Heterobilharzia americana]
MQFVSARHKKFILKFTQLNIAFSSMEKQVKKKAKADAALLHANILSEWSRKCNLLVMQFLVVTSKVVCALLCCVPIVTPSYLEEIKRIRMLTLAAKPDPRNFLPHMKEEKLMSSDAPKFFPNDLRRNLFHGKTFFVLNQEKYDRLLEIINLGSGKLYLLDSYDSLLTVLSESDMCTSGSSSGEDILRDVLSKPGFCVVHLHPTSVTELWQRKIYSVLRSLNQRPILESELGFAVVHCSTKLYCNPNKRCPDGLYHEINVSEAFSVNPFQIDSEIIPSELSESHTTMNSLKMSTSSCRNFPLKPKNNEWNNGQERLPSVATRPHKNLCETAVSKIVPARTPERKTLGGLLVLDSEPDSHQALSYRHQISSMDLENLEPSKCETLPKKPTNTSLFGPVSEYQPSVYSEEDLLSKLNSMPSLLQLAMKKSALSESKEKDKDSAVQPFSSPVADGFDHIESNLSQNDLSILNKDSTLAVPTEPNSCDMSHTKVNGNPLLPSTGERLVPEGWLRKRANDGADPSDNTRLAIVAPMTVKMQAVKPIVTGKQDNKINFKHFVKVWPTYLRHSAFVKPCARPYISKPIPLVSFEQTLEKNYDGCENMVKSKRPSGDEQERINQLFEEACKVPQLRKI